MRKFTSILFGFCLVMVIGVPSFTLFAQDTATPTPAPSSSRVAILVVDVFEVIGSSEYIEQPEEANCVISPNGQDGAAWGRTSAATETHLTSVLHPGMDPHGRIVYSELQALLRSQGATLAEHTTGEDLFENSASIPNTVAVQSLENPYSFTSSNPNQDWMRDVETWELGSDEILLVAVDTSEYEGAAIAQRIRETVNLFQNPQGSIAPVNTFVVNMSFAIIPCDAFPKVDFMDYVNLLAEAGLSELCDALAVQLGSGLTCQELGEQADEDNTTGIIQTVALNPREGLLYRVPVGTSRRQPAVSFPYSYQGEQPAGEVLFDILRLPEFDTVRNLVHQTYIIPQLASAFASYDSRETGQLASFINPGIAPPGLTPTASQIPATATALALTPLPQCSPKDPFYDLFDGDGCNDLCDDPGLTCISVASAGNDENRDFPYAPAMFQNVISVGAEYSGADACLAMLGGSGTADLHSNRGEVVMHGLYNCMAGTSFAAPRLSFLMALYHVRDHTAADCTGSDIASVTSGLPLDYADWMDEEWIDESIFTASDKYCETFDDTVFAP